MTVLDLLKKHFGYDQFRPLQAEIIASVLERRDTLVLMPTGGGKSLCYQLPALRFDGLTLVVSPLIALMKDQVDTLKANGIAAEFINSSLTYPELNRVRTRVRRNAVKILYVAPERLALSGFRDFLAGLKVSLVAVDEAHCISMWGHEFRPDYRNLVDLRRLLPGVPFIALTATATEQVRRDVAEQLELTQPQEFAASFNRANLTYSVRPKRNSVDALATLLDEYRGESCIVYCFSRKSTEDLATALCERGLSALPYHAGLDTPVRSQTQEKFIRDEVPIIVATIAFGMGIDKPDVRLVVHYDLPKSLEGYYQETGRAGRDGLPSECALFYSYGDKVKQDFFIDQIENAAEQRNAQDKLAQVIEFCDLQTCRRKYLLAYFGEDWPQDNCGGCDVCLTPREEFDATVIAQKILSAIVRTGERFGIAHLSQVLRGANTKRIRELRHDKLSVYGIVNDFSGNEIKEVAGLLQAKGLLRKDSYASLNLTQVGRTFLKNRENLTLTRAKQAEPAPRTTPDSDPAQIWRRRDAPPLTDEQGDLAIDTTLFEKLRTLRRRLAEERNVPPYVIFGDVTLRQMAAYLPQSRESLSRISGVGAAKLEQWGEAFLEVIRSHAGEQGLEERPVPGSRRGRESPGSKVSRQGSTHIATKQLLEQGRSITEIAAERGLSVRTVVGHVEKLVGGGEDVDLGPLLPSSDRLEAIQRALDRSGATVLAPVKAMLGKDYTYEEIRLVRAFMHQTQ
ncbi:MAG: DNA helicase RecQ [Desulfurellaceae bacterium]|nr:DNA helicase RecQ [Desulfurellaceae bacterium]